MKKIKVTAMLLVIASALCFTCLAAGNETAVTNLSPSNRSVATANNNEKSMGDKTVRIALCHLDLALGPQADNINKIVQVFVVKPKYLFSG